MEQMIPFFLTSIIVGTEEYFVVHVKYKTENLTPKPIPNQLQRLYHLMTPALTKEHFNVTTIQRHLHRMWDVKNLNPFKGRLLNPNFTYTDLKL